MRDSCGFALSVPDYVKRSCGFARIRPVPGRLWGVFCCALHGDENVTRRMSVSVPGYMKRSCGFARIRPVPGRLWDVCCCALHGDMKWSCGFAASVSGDIKWSCILASPSFSGDKKRGGPVAGAPLIIMQ